MYGRYMAKMKAETGSARSRSKNQRTLLGVHMIGNSSEIIYGAALMIEMEMWVDDVKSCVPAPRQRNDSGNHI